MKTRVEKDSMGEIEVPSDVFWGAQTQRSFENFKIGSERMPAELIRSIALVKKAAAFANWKTGVLPKEKQKWINQVCDEIIEGKLDEYFPLVVWQTGSGTQTNMNVNEVISNRIQLLKYGNIEHKPLFIHPNDDVNKSQSTNDVFPTAMKIAATMLVYEMTIPEIDFLASAFKVKAELFKDIVKTGRTHMMDATPVTLGQEMQSYWHQLKSTLETLSLSCMHLFELPLGGTATGSGLNAPQAYDKIAVDYIAKQTGLPFEVSECKASSMAAHDSFVELSSALKNCAVSLMKIGNDIRLLSSGPRCGLGELNIPENEPGSSIMPGKVNPTQVEALTMVCAQVIGNDACITISGMQGQLQLNVFMPVIIRNIIHSASLLADVCRSFRVNCVEGIEPNHEKISEHLQNSLMLVTALNPHIGYSNAAKIAQKAHHEGLTLRQAAIENGISPEDFDLWVNPLNMV